MKIAKGKVKFVNYTEDGAYLVPTINEGEKIPEKVLTVAGVDANGDIWSLYSINDTADDYEEKRDLFLKHEGTNGMVELLDECGVDIDWYEPEIEEIYCEVDNYPYQVVYDTSKNPEENQKAISDYFYELCWNYPQYSPMELIYQISNFFKYHIIDVVECLGGMDGVNKLWKELVEQYSLTPEHREGLKEEIRIDKIAEEGEKQKMSFDEALKKLRDKFDEIDVEEYVQDFESNIDAYCSEAEEILKRLKKSNTPLEVECERLKLDDQRKEISVAEKVAALYRRVVQTGEYDVKKGNEPIIKACQEGTIMEDFPAEMTKYFEQKSKKGCCLVFSSVIMKYLHDLGVKTWLIGTKEDTGIRASLMYVDSNGLPYVANPVADVEYFTNNGINTEEDRAKCLAHNRHNASFRTRGDCHNYGRIPLHDFEEMFGKIFMFGDFYDKKFDGVKFSEVKPKIIDVKDVYERLGKYWAYDLYEERSRTEKERAERRAKLNQDGQDNPADPDNQDL